MSIIPKDYTPTIVAKTHLEGAQFRDMEATPALTVQRTLRPIRATCTRPSASRLTASFPAIFGRHRGGEGRGDLKLTRRFRRESDYRTRWRLQR